MEKDFKDWLNLCLRAPSGDNCQPWIFEYFEDHFYIFIDQKAAQHFLDQNFAASWISLGSLCENLIQSAENYGFSCQCELEGELSVKVNFKRIIKNPNEGLIESIKSRVTFRGKLLKSDFSIQSFYQNHMPIEGQFKWQQREKVSEELVESWSILEALLWLKTPLMKDFTKWVHFTLNGYVDGVTLSNLMLNFMDKLALVSLKLFPPLIHLIPFGFFKWNSKKRLNFLLSNSSGLVFLTGKIKRSDDYFWAGREIQRLWLYMTERGLKAQPLSIQSLYFNYTDYESNKKYLSNKNIEIVNSIKKQTKRKLGVNEDIIFMLRFGASNEAIELLPRKSLDTLIKN